jgi:hypothetical protein
MLAWREEFKIVFEKWVSLLDILLLCADNSNQMLGQVEMLDTIFQKWPRFLTYCLILFSSKHKF